MTEPTSVDAPEPGGDAWAGATGEDGAYASVNGISMWYATHGSGEPLVALHPGLVDARAYRPNLPAWAAEFRVFTPEQRGHGHTADVDGPLSFADMAADTAEFIDRIVGGPVRLLGYSDGAIVALLTALRRQDLVRQLVLISGPAHHAGWHDEAIAPDNEAPEFMHEMYGELSPDGREHYPVVLEKLNRTHQIEPAVSDTELAELSCRTLVMLGDDDEVRLEHAVRLYRSLPRGELAIVPGTSHGLLAEKTDLCNRLILDFLTTDPVQTVAPLRRRHQP